MSTVRSYGVRFIDSKTWLRVIVPFPAWAKRCQGIKATHLDHGHISVRFEGFLDIPEQVLLVHASGGVDVGVHLYRTVIPNHLPKPGTLRTL
jgi:hypothetical protein